MSKQTLNAKIRTVSGKTAAKKLREVGSIPAVMYNSKGEATMLEVNEVEFNKIWRTITPTTSINLVVDGKETALPPVYITHPFGFDKNWIIQDTESMVDLTFTPLSVNSRTLNLIALRTSYHTMYGTFEGVLLDSNGEKIILKNFPGLLYKGMLRL